MPSVACCHHSFCPDFTSHHLKNRGLWNRIYGRLVSAPKWVPLFEKEPNTFLEQQEKGKGERMVKEGCCRYLRYGRASQRATSEQSHFQKLVIHWLWQIILFYPSCLCLLKTRRSLQISLILRTQRQKRTVQAGIPQKVQIVISFANT